LKTFLTSQSGEPAALDRARRKAYVRLLPLLFVCYVVAYVDRANLALAKLTMIQTLPDFTDAVIGLGAGLFFCGYFLLEIPGTLLVEKWSARKWICRIMVVWGIAAAMTALVKTPRQFYLVRFLLGLAEAGFFPGVIVYLTHWFIGRDRTRALAWFLIATPVAQIVSPRYPMRC
jgi:MFS transporter, ACS family, tartrate transporter